MEADEMSDLKEVVKRRPKGRAPMGGRNVLTVTNKQPDREYRVVNDLGDRVEIFKERGWRVETDKKMRVGDRRVATPGTEGSPVTAYVGGGQKAVIMSIERDLYTEDQGVKSEYLDDLDRSLRKGGDYGTVTVNKK